MAGIGKSSNIDNKLTRFVHHVLTSSLLLLTFVPFFKMFYQSFTACTKFDFDTSLTISVLFVADVGNNILDPSIFGVWIFFAMIYTSRKLRNYDSYYF